MTFLDPPSSFLDIQEDIPFDHARALHVERVDSPSGIDAVAAEWDRVQNDCTFRHVLLDHRWVRAWWNVFGPNKDLHNLVIREGSRARGIVPMVLSRGWEAWPRRDDPLQIAEDHANLDIPKWRRVIPVRRVTFPLNIPSQNARAHALLAGDPAPVCAAVLHYWSNRASEWDVMVLEGLPAESGQREAFTAAAAKEGFGALPSGRTRIMHRADLSGGMEAYLSKRTATFRKSRRRHMNQCHRAGEVELVTYRGENIRRGLSILFELERHTWKADPTRNDARMRVPLDDRIRLFLTEVGTAFASSDDAVVIVMNFNGIPVGAMMGVSRRSIMLALLTYLRDDMRDTLNTYPLMDAFIQDAIAHGMTSLDMNGVTEYTRRWATHEDRYQRLYIFNRHPKARILQVSKALATNLSQLSRSVEWDRNGDDDGSH